MLLKEKIMDLQITPVSFTARNPNSTKKLVSSLYYAQQKPKKAMLGAQKYSFMMRVRNFFKGLYYANFYKPKGNIKK